jgi:hypothetical protein
MRLKNNAARRQLAGRVPGGGVGSYASCTGCSPSAQRSAGNQQESVSSYKLPRMKRVGCRFQSVIRPGWSPRRARVLIRTFQGSDGEHRS